MRVSGYRCRRAKRWRLEEISDIERASSTRALAVPGRYWRDEGTFTLFELSELLLPHGGKSAAMRKASSSNSTSVVRGVGGMGSDGELVSPMSPARARCRMRLELAAFGMLLVLLLEPWFFMVGRDWQSDGFGNLWWRP
jgi:hypothetical protein